MDRILSRRGESVDALRKADDRPGARSAAAFRSPVLLVLRVAVSPPRLCSRSWRRIALRVQHGLRNLMGASVHIRPSIETKHGLKQHVCAVFDVARAREFFG